MYYTQDLSYIFIYGLLIAAFIISLVAQVRVQTTFSKYSGVASASGLTGAQVAAKLLGSQNVTDVMIGPIAGNLTDHYNPSKKTLALSQNVYDKASLAASAVAAHECGHAMQHASGYSPLKLRTAIVPVASISSKISWLFVIIGLFYNTTTGSVFLNIGIALFSAAVAFQLITLPVEFNASRRGLKLLESNGILTNAEVKGASKVLRAAALTYVASASVAVLQLLRLIVISQGRRR